MNIQRAIGPEPSTIQAVIIWIVPDATEVPALQLPVMKKCDRRLCTLLRLTIARTGWPAAVYHCVRK